MNSAYKLNSQGNFIQHWHTPFPFWNQSVFPCPVLAAASWPAYRFLKRQVKWSGIPISLRISHSLLWSTQSNVLTVNKAKVEVFLELSCFFYDPTDVGNLIFGSSVFSKSSLNIWKFTVHRMLKPGPLASPNFEPVRCSMSGTVPSWPADRFLRRQVKWSEIPISLRISHSLLWSTQSEALVQSMKQK